MSYFIQHCGADRPARVHFLRTRKEGLDNEVALIINCHVCKRVAAELHDYTIIKGLFNCQTIKKDDLPKLHRRISSDELVDDNAGPIVSEYTKEICKDPAHNYEKVLKRFKRYFDELRPLEDIEEPACRQA